MARPSSSESDDAASLLFRVFPTTIPVAVAITFAVPTTVLAASADDAFPAVAATTAGRAEDAADDEDDEADEDDEDDEDDDA